MTETNEHAGRRRRRPRAGRPSKGDRVPTWAQLPAVVWAWVHDEANAYDTSISQIVADIVCLASGHNELVRDLNRTRKDDLALPLLQTSDTACQVAGGSSDPVDIMTRLPVPAWEWVDAQAEQHSTSLKQIVSDVVCRASGHHDLVRALDMAAPEVLPLAI